VQQLLSLGGEARALQDREAVDALPARVLPAAAVAELQHRAEDMLLAAQVAELLGGVLPLV